MGILTTYFAQFTDVGVTASICGSNTIDLRGFGAAAAWPNDWRSPERVMVPPGATRAIVHHAVHRRALALRGTAAAYLLIAPALGFALGLLVRGT